MSNTILNYIPEPKLRFGYNQTLDNPKSGLFVFGPIIDERKPAEMRVGVIGTHTGIQKYSKWVEAINQPIRAKSENSAHHIAFPGFEAAFKTKWPKKPVVSLTVSETEISNCLRDADRHTAIYSTVSLFEAPIRDCLRNDDVNVDLWFVVIPEEIYKLGRPKSPPSKKERVLNVSAIGYKKAKQLINAPSLFEEDNQAAELYRYEKNFHNQLKARLLDAREAPVIQIVRETSLEGEVKNEKGYVLGRRMQDPASLAWNLCTTSFFKAGGRPWRLADVRKGVCYIGLVFKHDTTDLTDARVCCGAQMFLDSGDGLVFKGALGDWYSEETNEYHLSKEAAHKLIKNVVDAYVKDHGTPPTELFIHGKTRFNDIEWEGFKQAVPDTTKLVGVRITESKELKLFTSGNNAILRGTAYKMSDWKGVLWTRGFIPRLKTYQGREVPNPMSIEICKGKADILQVMEDVMGLTKVNFNSCIYADGFPVTLRFADAVGEILTAAPIEDLPPLPFRHYI